MTPLTIADLKALTIGWARARGASFRLHYPTKGGWEAWCQGDLIAFMLQRDSTYDLVREQTGRLANDQRVDLIANAQAQPNEQILVEMRAESILNHRAFVPGVDGDVTKLSNERLLEWQRSHCAVLAIAFSPEAVRGVEEIARGVRIFSRIAFESEWAVLMTQWDPHDGWMPV